MAATPETYTGEDASLQIGLAGGTGKTHTEIGIGEFSVTLDRGTVEQALVGQTGNDYRAGAMTIEGSFTEAEFGTDILDITLKSIISGTVATRVWG